MSSVWVRSLAALFALTLSVGDYSEAAQKKGTTTQDQRVRNGIPVDSSGGPTVDPTENVKALVQAEKERSDDLRVWQMRYFTAQDNNSKELAQLRADHAKELRSNDIQIFSNIRQVDITNQTAAAAQTQVAIKALADGVENTRKTLADAQAQLAARVDERLGALERSASLGEGKQRVSDPALSAMAEQVSILAKLQTSSAGKSEGVSALWGWIVGAVMFAIAVLGFLIPRMNGTYRRETS